MLSAGRLEMLLGLIDRLEKHVHPAFWYPYWVACGWLVGGIGWLAYILGGRTLLVVAAVVFVVEELFVLVRGARRRKVSGES